MNVQQHERIARIKKVSSYSYVCLTWIRYAFWAMYPLIAGIILFGSKGTLRLGDAVYTAAEMLFAERVFLLAVIFVFLFLMLRLINHFRALMRYFSAGDIFNKKAIDHARKALQHSLGIFGVYIVSSLAMSVYFYINTQSFHLSLDGTYVVVPLIFGVMFVLLWALEIGCDLNEEAEFTI